MSCRRIAPHNQDMNPPWLQLLDRLLVEPHELESIYAASHASSTDPDEMLRHFGASLWDVFSNNHTVERSRDRPLPAIVAAYRDVYNRLPTGWPK